MEALRAEQRVKAALAARIEELGAASQAPPLQQLPASPGGTPDLSVLLAQERLRTGDLQKVPPLLQGSVPLVPCNLTRCVQTDR